MQWPGMLSFVNMLTLKNDFINIFCVCVLIAQSCLTLYNLMACGPPSFSVMEFSRQEYSSEYPIPSFSRGSSQPRDGTQVSHITGRFFTVSVMREAQIYKYTHTHTHTLTFNKFCIKVTATIFLRQVFNLLKLLKFSLCK